MAVGPRTANWIDEAVLQGGARLVHVVEGDHAADATALVWTSGVRSEDLERTLAANPQVDWVQLPWAGVEPYRQLFADGRRWTCAKGAYGPPVAEHALALLLAGFRHLAPFARARTWERQAGRRLMGSKVVIVGGGGITRSLLSLLAPFGCDVTVVRRSATPLDDPDEAWAPHRVAAVADLHRALTGAEAVILTLALTDQNRDLIGAAELATLASGAWVVNVARGEHIDTDALVASLESGHLGGAALDVTAPEPLPDGHPLWELPNVLITPHSANTRAMAKPLLAGRITENVSRYVRGEDLLGQIDPVLGF